MQSDKVRKLKILPKHFPRRWKEVVFPEIRLAGKWLQDAGFVCGKSVSIMADNGKLVIEIVPDAKPNLYVVKKTSRRCNAKIIALNKEDESKTLGA